MGGAIAYLGGFLFKVLPAPTIVKTECVGLVWEAEESLAICLGYHLPNAPDNALPGLLEAISRSALEHPKLLVLGDFNIQADDAASFQARVRFVHGGTGTPSLFRLPHIK